MSHAPMPPPLLVPRLRLSDRLDQATALTLLRAPAGFGKTTLVAQWVRARTTQDEIVMWLRVRPGAGDEASFWSNALEIAADAGLVPPGVGRNEPVADAPLRLERALLASEVPVVLIIDGFEHVSSFELDLVLLDLLRHTPKLRLVVCLRGHHHFRANRHLDLDTTVLVANDLRFTEDETRDLLARADVELGPAAVRNIVEESGGWAEPIRALALRLADSPELARDLFGLVQRVAADFLRDRFLVSGSPPALIEFALVTSLPDSFTGELAEVLTQDKMTKCYLETLSAEGLLAAEPRDGDLFFYWPPAARRALLDELRRRQPERLRGLHEQLAHWYVDHDRVSQAIGHAASAHNWRLVISIIESSWRALIFAHNEDLHQCLSAIPTAFVMSSRRALAVRDWAMHVHDNLFLAATVLPESTSDLKALGRGEDVAEVLDTCLVVLLALRIRGDLDAAVAYGARVLIIADAAQAAHANRVRSLHPTIQLQVGITRMLGGDLAGAISPLTVAVERGAGNPLGYVTFDAAGKLALAHAIVGDHAMSASWINRHDSELPHRLSWFEPHIGTTSNTARLLTALDQLRLEASSMANHRLADITHRDEFWPYIIYARAQYALTVGAPADALALLDRVRAARLGPRRSGPVVRALLTAAEADLLLALGRANLARAALDGPDRDNPLLRVPRARLALLGGQNTLAMHMAQDSSWDRVATARERLEMQLIHSVAALRTGSREVASAALRYAADAARASEVLRPFTTVPRAELLIIAETVPAALDLLNSERLTEQPDLFPAHVKVIELTQREQEVLQELADGLTVPQIAAKSVLSYNTVRTQQRSLYKKLGTSDRPEAIARARQWGLLPLGRVSAS